MFLDAIRIVVMADDFNSRHTSFGNSISSSRDIINFTSFSSLHTLSNSTNLISQRKISKDFHLGNSSHLPVIIEIDDNTVLRINSFISRKLLLDRLSNVTFVSDISSIQDTF